MVHTSLKYIPNKKRIKYVSYLDEKTEMEMENEKWF